MRVSQPSPGGNAHDLIGNSSPRIGRGILAMGSAQIVNHATRVLTLILLARLLLPEAMGVVSVAILIADMLWLVIEMGIGTAIIQRNTLTDACYTRLLIRTGGMWLLSGGKT